MRVVRPRWRRKDVDAAKQRMEATVPATAGLFVPPPAGKYSAKRTMVDGYLFDSKLEARRYGELKLLMLAGEILWLCVQPVFILEGGVTYRADFLYRRNDGEVIVEDAKGKDLQVSRNKRKQVLARYGVEIQLWPAR